MGWKDRMFADCCASCNQTVETAYAGDIVGFVNPGAFSIGDTITLGRKIQYDGIPSFSPELFNWIRNTNPSKQKNFRKGIDQLREEGAMQVSRLPSFLCE